MNGLEIRDEDNVRRHVNPLYIKTDGSISTAAFKGDDISLDLCRLRTLPESVQSRLTAERPAHPVDFETCHLKLVTCPFAARLCGE